LPWSNYEKLSLVEELASEIEGLPRYRQGPGYVFLLRVCTP
jgi:hypothetical protein